MVTTSLSGEYKPGKVVPQALRREVYSRPYIPRIFAVRSTGYAQTKAATMKFIKSLGKQLAAKGIRVNGVAPGPIWTPLQVSGGASQEKLEKFGSMTPTGRAGQPAELGSIYVQLADSDASFATGQVYGSSGGTGQALMLGSCLQCDGTCVDYACCSGRSDPDRPSRLRK